MSGGLVALLDDVAALAKLAVIAPDLLDGDVHLFSNNLARISNAILDLKKVGGL